MARDANPEQEVARRRRRADAGSRVSLVAQAMIGRQRVYRIRAALYLEGLAFSFQAPKNLELVRIYWSVTRILWLRTAFDMGIRSKWSARGRCSPCSRRKLIYHARL